MANQSRIGIFYEGMIVRILDDSVLERYNESIKGYNKRARESLGKFGRSNGELTGSSPLMIIQLVNSGALPEGTRLATVEELSEAVSEGYLFLAGHNPYFLNGINPDVGLVLRSADDSYSPNNLLSDRLVEQLSSRGIELEECKNFNQKYKRLYGKFIPFDLLYLTQYRNSAYGLVIDLKDGAERAIRDLDEVKHLDWDHGRDEGLSCAVFCRDRLHSDLPCLSGSCDRNRVVVVSDKSVKLNKTN